MNRICLFTDLLQTRFNKYMHAFLKGAVGRMVMLVQPRVIQGMRAIFGKDKLQIGHGAKVKICRDDDASRPVELSQKQDIFAPGEEIITNNRPPPKPSDTKQLGRYRVVFNSTDRGVFNRYFSLL